MAHNKIKFDEIKQLDTKLAEEYLQKQQKQFHSRGFKDTGKTRHDAYKNLIYFADYTRFAGPMISSHNLGDRPQKLFNLAKKIEENFDLFCQLDYLIRKTPIHENKNADLQLLFQNLLNCCRVTSNRIFCGGFIWIVWVDAETSLAALGCVAQALMSGVTHVAIECTADTAAVCCLFTDLCYEVGLQEKVQLAILPEKLEGRKGVVTDFKEIYELRDGCVGIVTAKSDVDSAVETFLAATDRYPWNVKKILVQESVLEQFKNTLEWKTNSTGIYNDLQALSASAYRYKRKTFLCEFAGTDETKLDKHSGDIILIDGYRTTKELISLLKTSNHFAASLWCSDLAESNEIAFNIPANIVWVNDFCNFKGPPKSAQAFYSLIDAHLTTASYTNCAEIEEVMKLRESWLQIDKSKREDIVRDILKNAPVRKPNTIDVKNINFAFDSFARVEGNTVCYGTEVTPVIMQWTDPLDVYQIAFVAKGGGLILHLLKYYSDNDFTKRVCEALREKGAPVVGMNEYLRHWGEVRILDKPIYRMKVVWSHFGTIFAN